MRILVIENEIPDYEDIKACLPKFIQHDHRQTINIADIDCLPSDFSICISDLLEETRREVAYESNEISMAFRRRVKLLSKLKQKINCKLLICTKMPAYEIWEHLKTLDDDSDANALFADEYDKLHQDLNIAKDNGSKFIIYQSSSVYIISKLFIHFGEENERWKKLFTELMNGLCEIDK